MQRFLGALTWSFVGGIAGAGMLAASSMLAARLLGSEQFGRASLVLTTANLLMTLCILGLDGASTRVIGRAGSDSERTTAVSTSAFVVVALFLVMGATMALGAPVVARPLEVPESWIYASIAVGCGLTMRFHADKFAAALGWFRTQTMSRVVEGSIVLVAVVALGIADTETWQRYVTAVATGAGVGAAILAVSVRRYLHVSALGRPVARELWAFSKWGLVGTIFPLVIVFGDKLLIQRELGSAALGRYTAYQTVSVLVVSQLLTMFSNAFLPAVIRADDKAAIVRMLWRITKLSALPLFAGLCLLVGVASLVYGSEFDIGVPAAVGFAAYSTLYLINGMFRNIVVPHSEHTYFLSVMFQAVRAVAFVGLLSAALLAGAVTIGVVIWTLVVIELLEGWNFATIIRRHIMRQ